MSVNKKKILAYTFLLLGMGVLIYFGYSHYQLIKERDTLLVDLDREQQKFKHLQKKYAEQKAQTAVLQRAKLAQEGKLRQAQKELDAMQAEKETLQTELAHAEEKFSGKIVKLEDRIEKYKEQLQKLVDNRDQYKEKLAETVEIVRERNTVIQTLTAEKDELTLNLQETTSTLNRCVKHNTRLCVLAEEVIEAYENKGTGTALLQGEPFTQLKKVEIEQLVQVYLDRIDNENLELIKQGPQ